MSTFLSAAEDALLIENGYEPTPIAGQACVAHGWQHDPVTPGRIAQQRLAHPGARSTGLRTGLLIGVDIDVVNPEHAAKIKETAWNELGPTPLVRVGSKGFMLC